MKVIELAHIMSGPACGRMLADMGADVVKVEKPEGDDTRRFLPPDINGEAAAFMMMNRNKRGIVIDLKSAAGKEALLRLVSRADVLIENFRQGTMEGLGLGYEALRQINPGLIYCEISGFGRTGPYAGRGGFDLIAQGMSGLMSITGEAPGRPPVKVGAPVSDIVAGILAAMGVSAAYAAKLKTGQGQKVDTSLFEAGITLTYWQSAIAFATGQSPGPMGSAHPLNAPYQAFETADGWINVGAANQRNWERLLKITGQSEPEHDPEKWEPVFGKDHAQNKELEGDADSAGNHHPLARDPRFATNQDRMNNREALVDALTPIFRAKPAREWLQHFEEAGVPAGPVLSVSEMHEDPQAIAREMVPWVDHPVAGRVQTIGAPVKFSGGESVPAQSAPLLGQHTREVLAEAGYSDSEIEDLIAQRAVEAA
jgi:crotonobetainyl-CoA:carnitine CoA-transferase CaiB-like acyl-CoA transferase